MKKKIIKDISQYFSVEIESIKPCSSLEYDIYLYFKQSFHVILLKQTGDEITADQINTYIKKGMRHIWIHQTQKEIYVEQCILHKKTIKRKKMTQEGALMSGIISATTLPDEKKKVIISETAKEVLTNINLASEIKTQDKIDEVLQTIVYDVIDEITDVNEKNVYELFKLSETFPHLVHSSQVTTYTMLFAMAFKNVDPTILNNIALASLLHDIGISLMTTYLARKPFSEMTYDENEEYQKHVLNSIDTILKSGIEVKKEVQDIILHHHECFNGTGYPNKLKGFQISEASQLISIADTLTSLKSGQWDGKKRTLNESLLYLEEQEDKNFPVLFNPEIFQKIIKWIKKDKPKSTMESISKIIEDQATALKNVS